MAYNFSDRAALLGFSKKLEAAKQEAVVNGRAIALAKHLRSDDWEYAAQGTWLVPDVLVTPRGRVLAFTLVGRRAIAEAAA